MAFNATYWAPYKGGSAQSWEYKTEDGLNTLLTAGYFLNAKLQNVTSRIGAGLPPKVGDLIYVSIVTNLGTASEAASESYTLKVVTSTTSALTVRAVDLTPPAAGAGITGGTGTLIRTGVEYIGGLVKTTILIDIDGLRSTAGADIIGVDGTSEDCYLTQWNNNFNGTCLGGRMTCLEVPAGGDVDIDLFSAVESTGSESDAITGLDETKLIDHGDWSVNTADEFVAVPSDGEYIYLATGADADVDGEYTTGIFLIEFWGYM